MSDKNIFEEATRQSLRFDTQKGSITVEDLWHLPLTSTVAGKPNLDDVGVALLNQLNATADSVVSLVKPVTDSGEKRVLELKFSVVKHIIDVLVAERDAKAEAAARREKKQTILALIAQKEIEQVTGQSLEELRKIADSL